ncbi:hypothetical protein [Thalassospira xiamenensis]|jgi:hypothetical protein|uniref:Uncharacterized protein n=1 Tax=Thalassospira xiamenensis TaxID=220697 RepID=A0A367WUF6_9PROT|nr:hypothetical protein [Thalassospira xiamenensis]KZB54108.1 hypothetical protein AUP41_20130 [Thalassospira xiamenensis]MCK2168754.1 hypothetical protein [Thalassospira xiamenensis]RCK44151.1 hypothetical protein TH44_22820 [Thalassospira xiamenensis]
MKKSLSLSAMAVAASLAVAAPAPAFAQQDPQTTAAMAKILGDVIGNTIRKAAEDVRANTGIDPLTRGYGDDGNAASAPVPANPSDDLRRELATLNAAHDQAITTHLEELHGELEKAELEFQNFAERADNANEVRDRRDSLQTRADTAYEKFTRNIAAENARFDEKRAAVLQG